jgi:hypothetical protein
MGREPCWFCDGPEGARLRLNQYKAMANGEPIPYAPAPGSCDYCNPDRIVALARIVGVSWWRRLLARWRTWRSRPRPGDVVRHETNDETGIRVHVHFRNERCEVCDRH